VLHIQIWIRQTVTPGVCLVWSSACHVPTRLAHGTRIKTIIAEGTGSLLINQYSTSVTRWYKVLYADIQRKEHAFTWNTPVSVWRSFDGSIVCLSVQLRLLPNSLGISRK
jgi:hypothetical protein